MIFRGGLNDLSIPLSISSTLRRHNFFCIDAIIYSHNIRSRVDAPASTQGRIDASLPKLHRTFHFMTVAAVGFHGRRKRPTPLFFTFPFLLLLHLKFRKSRFCSSFHSTLLPEQIFGGGGGERETCMGKFRWTEFRISLNSHGTTL